MRRVTRRDALRVLGAGFGSLGALAWEPARGQSPGPSTARPSPIWSVAFHPDGRYLASGAYRKVHLWDVEGGQLLATLEGPSGQVRCLAWSADGRQLAAGSGTPGIQGEVRLWSVESGKPSAPGQAWKPHKDVVEGVAFAPSGKAILTAGLDEKALACDPATGKILHTMADHTNRVSAVGVSPDGRYVATASLDRTVKIWSASDYQPLANVEANVGQVYGLAFLPQDGQLAAAGEDGNVRIYRLAETRTGNLTGLSGRQVRAVNGDRTPVLAIAAAAKAPVLAWAGAGKVIHILNLADNKRQQFKEPTDAVYSVAVSSGGSTLAAGGRDGKLRLWSLAENKLLAELQP